MTILRKLIEQIYNIVTEDLSANCGYSDHLEYIEYRLCGGRKSEENWFMEQAKPIGSR